MDRKEIAFILANAEGGALRPRHHLGQNFMVSPAALLAIADAGEIAPGDVILEVGPGVGNLTRLLAQRAMKGAVLAVDIDHKLLPTAQRHHAELTNVTWLLADVLAGKHHIEPRVLAILRELRATHPDGQLKLVSNLPYNAASPLVAELLVEMWREQVNAPAIPLVFSRLVFTVQWEVALRMNAKPDTRDYGPLGILIQSMAEVAIVRKIPPGAFWPPPKIHSALVVVTPQPERIKKIRDAVAFQKFLAGIFGHRRQTLGNALKHFYKDVWQLEFKSAFTAAGNTAAGAQEFDLGRRSETFGIEELLALEAHAHAFASSLPAT